MPLSAEEAALVDMDNASCASLKLYRKKADNTAINAKMEPEIAHYFKTSKTINPNEYGK